MLGASLHGPFDSGIGMLKFGCHLIRQREQHAFVSWVDEVYLALDSGTLAESVVGDRGSKIAVGFLE